MLCSLLTQLPEQLCKASGAAGEEPAQPHALALDIVKAVVPVAAAHVGQAVASEAPGNAHIHGGPGVLKNRCTVGRNMGCFVAVIFLRRKNRGG